MYNRTFARIDLDAIQNNFDRLCAALPAGVKKACVIKADAYGHGATEIASLLEDKADMFCVAMVDEAIELRNKGIKKPILILGFSDRSEFADIINYNVTATVYSLADAEALCDEARKYGQRAHAHIAVDTGMSRIGFFTDESSIDEIAKICALPDLSVDGIFSHYACADCADKTIKDEQTREFDKVLDGLNKRGVSIPIRHICNSAASIETDKCYDMVRLGIALYGLEPSDEIDISRPGLKPAMELISHVVYVKTLPAGRGVSYGHTYHTERETRVATVCAGYADGYPRALSNRGHVIIRGKKAPIIGRVCMDQMMVDVSSIPDTAIGDEVTLMGGEGPDRISPELIGEMSGSFNYEMICGISRRIPRVYIRDGKQLKTVNYIL